MKAAPLAAAALLIAPLAAAPAGAWPSAEDLEEIRGVVARQVQGLGEPRAGLAPSECNSLIRPARITFAGLVVIGGGVVQQVRIVDGAGARWHAFFSLERQPDGRWRTSSCRLAPPAATISA